MLIDKHEIPRRAGAWSVDNWFVNGEIVLGTYLLLHEDHEVARGSDPYELLKIADRLNAMEEREAA